MVAASGWDSYLKRVFNKTTGLLDEATWLLNFNTLVKAVVETFMPFTQMQYNATDTVLASKLVEDAGVFAAFKNHQCQNDLVMLMIDSNGQLRSFSDFKNVAAPLVEQYNATWLKTEYNQALAEAMMAKKWDGFVRDKDLYPNLEYRAVLDERTRTSHAELHGTILPIDHPFWNSHYPPLDWGCRCDVVATDRAASSPEIAAALTIVAGRGPVAPGFDHNPGKDGKLFSNTAGYYQSVNNKVAAELRSIAYSWITDQLDTMSYTSLEGKFVRWQNLRIEFPDGAGDTMNHNETNGVLALILCQNVTNIQEIINKGSHVVMGVIEDKDGNIKEAIHSWKLDALEVTVTQTDQGKAHFVSLKVW